MGKQLESGAGTTRLCQDGVIFIGCGKSKRPGRQRADQKYTGLFFKTCLSFAKTFGIPVFILSAKYGILSLSDPVDDYDIYLGDHTKEQRQQWREMVWRQVRDRGLRKKTFYFVTGPDYVFDNKKGIHLLSSMMPYNRGIGDMTRFMKQYLKNITRRNLL